MRKYKNRYKNRYSLKGCIVREKYRKFSGVIGKIWLFCSENGFYLLQKEEGKGY